MFTYEMKSQAVKDLRKLPPRIQKTIISKLDYFVASPNPLAFAQRLINHAIGDYRFRIGDYRIIFDLENDKIIILTLGHRRDIYK